MSIAEGIQPISASTNARGTAPVRAPLGQSARDEKSAWGSVMEAAASVETASRAITSLIARSRNGNRPMARRAAHAPHRSAATRGIDKPSPNTSLTRKAVNNTTASWTMSAVLSVIAR